MSTNRINWIAIALTALVLVNIGLVATIWVQRKEPVVAGANMARRGPDLLPTELGFDSVQRARFEVLRDNHRSTTRAYREQLRELKEEFFDGVKRGEEPADGLLAAMTRIQADIDRGTYRHFVQVRALCRNDQKETFDRMLHRVLAQMGAPRPPRPEGPPDGRPWDDGPGGPPPGGPDGPPPVN
ncbi:MAG: hypothetical protein EOO16_09765 [Chitinophagaceae bacterium]|nr:MAG: hypothetical protein EOO16_09765 [Chitinophagaceae bacterium]